MSRSRSMCGCGCAARFDRALAMLGGLLEALVAVARKYPDAVIPGYSTPAPRRCSGRTTSSRISKCSCAIFERLGEARAPRQHHAPGQLERSPEAAFPFDREAMARELGFESANAQQHGCFRATATSRSISLRGIGDDASSFAGSPKIGFCTRVKNSVGWSWAMKSPAVRA